MASPETVRMFLLPSTSPKLRTLTAYAASAMGAKLSFAFTIVTDKVVNPQLSTSLFYVSRSYFAPIIKPYANFLTLVMNQIWSASLTIYFPFFFSIHMVLWWRRGVLPPCPVRFSIRITELYFIYTTLVHFCQ